MPRAALPPSDHPRPRLSGVLRRILPGGHRNRPPQRRELHRPRSVVTPDAVDGQLDGSGSVAAPGQVPEALPVDGDGATPKPPEVRIVPPLARAQLAQHPPRIHEPALCGEGLRLAQRCLRGGQVSSAVEKIVEAILGPLPIRRKRPVRITAEPRCSPTSPVPKALHPHTPISPHPC